MREEEREKYERIERFVGKKGRRKSLGAGGGKKERLWLLRLVKEELYD